MKSRPRFVLSVLTCAACALGALALGGTIQSGKPPKGYTRAAFDPNATNLGTGYLGHDVNAFFEGVGKLAKDTFESTAEYNQRLAARPPVMGALTLDDNFAFALDPDIQDSDFSYDADARSLNVTLRYPLGLVLSSRRMSAHLLTGLRKDVRLSGQVAPERARELMTKGRLRLLAVCKVTQPAVRDVRVKLLEVWAYDIVTGEVLIKHPVPPETAR